MTTTAHHLNATSALDRPTTQRTLPWVLIAALIALAAVTVAVAIWQLTAAPASQGQAVTTISPSARDWAANQAGGSVYNSQVPPAAQSVASSAQAANRPGGSVYTSQVPKGAQSDTSAFPGGASAQGD